MAPKKRRSDEGEEEEKKPVIVKRELMVTRSSTRRLNGNSATDSLSSPKPESKPRRKKAKTSAKEDLKEQKVQVQTAEVKAVADDSSKTIVIEHCTQMEQSQTQSTPSKALHKRGSKQTQQQSANVHKASWDSDTVRIFLELVIKELDVGFKGSFHTMTMHGYQAISKGFLDRTNKVHDVKQLQNKYALLKKDWQSWSKLMDSRHGPTGISYNEATGLIQASDDWWAHYEKVDKNAIKFKTKPLEHMDLMRRVYEGATATGKYAWTPGAAFEPVAPDDGTSQGPEEDCEDSSGLPPFQPAAQHEHTVQHTVAQEDGTPATVHAASSGINADGTPTSGMNKRKSPGPTHPQRKKGQSEGASLLASSMENLASSVKLQQRQIRVSHDYADSAQQLIQKCMTRLYSLEGLDPQDPLVPFAQSILDNPANQAIMMLIPTDTAVIAWLRTKKSLEQCIGGSSAANPGMGGGWF
ncbi:L10-interacting MYB domain-containing protein [Camellia lanceoleosa]|uniref:L10-interacting MYB domain-containing protein n=1 Tax=Camellia lanceoleosa TaxID=1840588 RepID=A0ACC0GBQ6_9ERIC|nr:L10-interacting MYB domain-containing protein [Camellia lanceoleosa]